jgi:hypothetical protein
VYTSRDEQGCQKLSSRVRIRPGLSEDLVGVYLYP